jgi:predicted dehydrogenase
MSRLNVAVVGVGALGRHHARILAQAEDVNLIAVADPNSTVGQAVASAHDTTWLDDYHALFQEPYALDAVCIAVPTTYHYAVASEFLRRGIPTFVEKPLATGVEQSAQLVELADRHQAILQVGHVERFNPATRVAFSMCDHPKYIHAERLSPFSFRSTDIGVVHDLMIHDIDLILSLVNSPVAAVEGFGVGLMGKLEDSVRARIKFKNGCIADLIANRVNPTARRAMEIWSLSGRTLVDFTTREVVHYRPSETLRYGTSPIERAAQPGADIDQLKKDVFGTFLEVLTPAVSQDDALTAELVSFANAVRANTGPECDGHQALLAMQVAEQVLHAVNSHRWDGHAEGLTGPHFRVAKERKLAG